jgi:hypothetical protein
MHTDVDWPNVLDGVRLHGHDEVRAYWSRQFATFDPKVQPVRITLGDADQVIVEVHQVIRAVDGALLSESDVQHVYTLRDGLVARMDVRPRPATMDATGSR